MADLVALRLTNNIRCCRCLDGWIYDAPLPRPCHCLCHPADHYRCQESP